MVFDTRRHNTKFGLLALDDCDEVHLGVVDGGDGVSFHSTCPIVLPEHWQQWLGTLEVGHLHESNLVIAVQVASATPNILDAETHAVDEHLLALFYCLLLGGIPGYRSGVVVLGGIAADGELSVRRHYRVRIAYRHQAGARPFITEDAAKTATRRADVLLQLHKSDDFRRLREGFRACVAGIEEPTPQERIHQYVRAIDGLMQIPAGQGQGKFAARGQTFVSGTSVAGTLIDLYRLRNAQEHLNPLRDAIAVADEAEFQRIGSLRAYQAEQTALFCYGRLFDDSTLLEQFRSETSTDAFWALDDNARRVHWGDPLSLDEAEAYHNRAYPLVRGWL